MSTRATARPTGAATPARGPVTRRRALGLAGLAGLGAVLAACGTAGSDAEGSSSASAGSDDALAKIRKDGVIRIGMEGTFRPYGYHDSSGKLVGFEKEIADLIAADLGVRAEYVETQWDSLIAGVDAGRYDIVINNIAPTDERKKAFDFSIPYAVSQGRVGVAKDSALHSVDEVSGHSAAQTLTSNYGQQMAEHGAQIVPVTGFDEAAMLVHYGRVDCTANDFVTFDAFFRQRPDINVRLLDGVLGDAVDSAILMGKGQTALKDAIDASLRRHIDDGDLTRIYAKYVSQDLTPSDSQTKG